MQIGVPIPGWGVAAAVLAAAIMAWWAYARPPVDLTRRQRATLTALRLGVLLGVLFLLLRPLRTEPAPPGAGVVAVLVDHSRSMAIPDAAGVPRIERARSLVRDRLLPVLGGAFDVEVLAFGEALAAVDVDAIEALAARSEIAGALDAVRERFGGRALAGVVVVSDGVATDRRAVAEVAARSPAPIYAVGVGSPRPGPDREVTALDAGEPVATRSVVDVSATIVSRGLGDASFEVRLRGRGASRRRAPRASGARRCTGHRSVPGGARSRADDRVHGRGAGRRRGAGAGEQPPGRSWCAPRGRAVSCSSKGRPATSTAFSAHVAGGSGAHVRRRGAERAERPGGADVLRPGRSGTHRHAGREAIADARGAVPVRRRRARQHRGGVLSGRRSST